MDQGASAIAVSVLALLLWLLPDGAVLFKGLPTAGSLVESEL
jgi:hypothetical protein